MDNENPVENQETAPQELNKTKQPYIQMTIGAGSVPLVITICSTISNLAAGGTSADFITDLTMILPNFICGGLVLALPGFLYWKWSGKKSEKYTIIGAVSAGVFLLGFVLIVLFITLILPLINPP
jgi:riboflavin transporter FmnP